MRASPPRASIRYKRTSINTWRIIYMERVRGIEPLYPTWKAGALADVLHPHGWGNPKITPEKIGTLKKGEKIFSLFPVLLLYQKNFEKSTHFLMNQRQYS